MASLFGITAAEVQRKLVPRSDTLTLRIADDEDADLSTAEVDEIIAHEEATVLARISTRYRALLRVVDGEILTRHAAGGETSFTVGLFPVLTETMVLWKNFTAERMWRVRDRSMAMDAGEFSVNLSTGVITLAAPLQRGDVLFAEYGHGAAPKVLVLRGIVLSLVAVEVGRRCVNFREASGFDRFDGWEKKALGDLNRIEGIEELDRLELVNMDTDPDNFYNRVLMLPT